MNTGTRNGCWVLNIGLYGCLLGYFFYVLFYWFPEYSLLRTKRSVQRKNVLKYKVKGSTQLYSVTVGVLALNMLNEVCNKYTIDAICICTVDSIYLHK